MGYTHYWQPEKPYPSNAWDKLVKDTRKLFAACKAENIALSDGHKGGPLADRHHIFFNGVGNEAYEDFGLERAATGLDYCKTEYRRYDRVVCAVLALAQHYEPSCLVTSDGFQHEWQPHLTWAESVLGHPVAMPPRIKPKPSED